VDMPPVLAVSDAAPFFAKLDGVLLLARAGRAPLGVYQGALDQIERLGGKVLGTIFNGFDARRSGRGYGYSYGGYYGYHSYYGYDERSKGKKSSTRERETVASDSSAEE
jgi:Mrp family chromosome partitioning ATPase